MKLKNLASFAAATLFVSSLWSHAMEDHLPGTYEMMVTMENSTDQMVMVLGGKDESNSVSLQNMSGKEVCSGDWDFEAGNLGLYVNCFIQGRNAEVFFSFDFSAVGNHDTDLGKTFEVEFDVGQEGNPERPAGFVVLKKVTL